MLVCAAGILRVGALATLGMAEWDDVMDVNLKGVLLSCQEAIRVMRTGAGLARDSGADPDSDQDAGPRATPQDRNLRLGRR